PFDDDNELLSYLDHRENSNKINRPKYRNTKIILGLLMKINGNY
ncbi:21942_t:CDS:1, partial [Dentiscutata erythropus]